MPPRATDVVIVSAELISVQDDSVIWGEQFTRKMSDVAKLQTDIAKAISDRVRLKLSGEKKRQAENGEAYQLYLQALYSLNKRTPDHIEKSIGFFQQVVNDPRFQNLLRRIGLPQ